MKRTSTGWCAGLVLIAGSAVLAASAAAPTAVAAPARHAWPVTLAAARHRLALPAPVPQYRLASRRPLFTKPPSAQQCSAEFPACAVPAQYQAAYNLGPLYKKGLTGKGETIVVVDPYGYYRLGSELKTFDKAFKLPAPPSFKVIHPAGKIPPYNPVKRPGMRGWGTETSLDAEYAHAMAPGASIIQVATPVSEDTGTSGFPQIVKAENYVIRHHLGTVISQSLDTAEQTFPSKQSILRLRSAYVSAAQHHISVLGATGDNGPSGYRNDGHLFLRRVTAWPASDPLVTAVGGTQMFLDPQGGHFQPDATWNDTGLQGFPAASGGGRSVTFARPAYQKSVARVVGDHRGVPDISMAASLQGAPLVYLDSKVGFSGAGFYSIGGTSLAAPLFAGVVAIADQIAGHGLGLLNPALYKMSAQYAPGIVDVTAGTTTVPIAQGGRTHTVRGFDAVNGYDLATGLGTINGALFIPELAKAAG
jgi:subtilase family serine protease